MKTRKKKKSPQELRVLLQKLINLEMKYVELGNALKIADDHAKRWRNEADERRREMNDLWPDLRRTKKTVTRLMLRGR